MDVFSSRLVVASIAVKVFARAAYGTLNWFECKSGDKIWRPTPRPLSIHPQYPHPVTEIGPRQRFISPSV